MGARPQRPPHWVGKGLGGVGKWRGRDLGGAWRSRRAGWKGRRDPGGRPLGPPSSEPCLWLQRFDLLPGKPGRSGRAAAKPRSEEPVERTGLHHPPSPCTHLLSPAPQSETAWPPSKLPPPPHPTPFFCKCSVCGSPLGSGLEAPSHGSKLSKCPASLVLVRKETCYFLS